MESGDPPTNRQCDFSDFVQLLINLFDWGLAILSILSILFFLVGGTIWIVSGGNENRIALGKSILSNTLLGVVIALGSWLIINTVIGLLVGGGNFQDVRVFGRAWWGAKTCTDSFKDDCLRNSLKNGCGDVSTSYVSQLQTLLSSAPGCPAITADGCFGDNTEQVVQMFNEHNGIGSTDAEKKVARQATWDALEAGKGCTDSGQPIQGTGQPGDNGCCIPRCGDMISQTGQSNCLEGIAQSLQPQWISDPQNPGSCPTTSERVCCIPTENISSGTCYANVTRAWCDEFSGTSNPNNVDCSGLTQQCDPTRIVSCQ